MISVMIGPVGRCFPCTPRIFGYIDIERIFVLFARIYPLEHAFHTAHLVEKLSEVLACKLAHFVDAAKRPASTRRNSFPVFTDRSRTLDGWIRHAILALKGLS